MPRKTSRAVIPLTEHRSASMRPRPDAAENVEAFLLRVAELVASMRPRPDAAENVKPAVVLVRVLPASMRPRPDAAENFTVAGRGALMDAALQ